MPEHKQNFREPAQAGPTLSVKRMKQGCAYLLYKESGDTSFQAIRKLQKMYGLQKVGHCGTLDKFAEGLLVVLSNGATRLAGAITGLDKRYIAEIEFGSETETLDPEGRVVREAELPSEQQIRQALGAWLEEILQQNGVLRQQAPAFSAIHSEGKRLYQRALAGEDMNGLPSRRVVLYSCRILYWEAPLLKLELHCSKGFYVRSFARDLALRCASAGHLRSLRRTAIGSLQLKQANKLSQGVRPVGIPELLEELDGQLALDIWQTGRDIYCVRQNEYETELPDADWALLLQGRIPREIFQAAQQRYEQPKPREAGLEPPIREFVVIHRGQVLAMFRYQYLQAQPGKDRETGPLLRFWHNFSAQCEN